MKEYTEQEKQKLIAEAKAKARKCGVREESLSIIDSHAEKPYQIENIEDFLKIGEENIDESMFWLWFTLDNE